METITGTIETISRAYNNGWRFASIHPHGTVVGMLPEGLQPGDVCRFSGAWKQHEKYGRQFQADDASIEIPSDVRGVRDYLDRHFKYIGPSIAARLIEAFGDDLFDVIEHYPERLESIRGITPGRAREIHAEYLQVKNDRKHDVFFATHGITLGMRNRLVDQYGGKTNAIAAIKENPYALADAVWGVGFKKADKIALSIGVLKDSAHRLGAGVRWVLEEASQGEGHCYLPAEELLKRSREILEVGEDAIKEAVNNSIRSGTLTVIGGAVYRTDVLAMERAIARKLRPLASSRHERMMVELSSDNISGMDEDQRRALNLALSSKVVVITGGPGVGKTYTINRIIQALGDADIALAAPTGKAAKRMAEMSGRSAKTIHRLLVFNPEFGFLFNAHNPLTCDTLIIDETSMLDISLMYHLMDAVKDQQIIFVGDVNQLPSVGPGAVLSDLISSGVIPVAYLKTLHRQAAASSININAQRINSGQKLLVDKEKRDLVFIQEEDPLIIATRIMGICQKIPESTEFRPDDIQVLCPQKRGPIGTENMNTLLRPVLNPTGGKLKGVPFHHGDRVIQTRNNYQLGIFNGDIGRVVKVDENYLFVEIDGDEVSYPLSELSNLKPAYALTVHKSQGSEFPVVIMPIHTTNYMMLKKNLIYTGITRGKKLVVLVGTMKAANLAIRTVDTSTRYTTLARFLKDGE